MMDITAQVITIGSTFVLASLIALAAFYLILKYYANRAKSTPYAVVAFILTVTIQMILFRISLRGAVEGSQQGFSIVASLSLYSVAGVIAMIVLVMIGLLVNFLAKEHDGKQHTLTIMTNEGKPLVYVDIAINNDTIGIITRSDGDTSLKIMFDEEVVPAQYQEQPVVLQDA